MRFFDDGDDGRSAAVAETFLIAQESALTDIILTEDEDNLEQESAP